MPLSLSLDLYLSLSLYIYIYIYSKQNAGVFDAGVSHHAHGEFAVGMLENDPSSVITCVELEMIG